MEIRSNVGLLLILCGLLVFCNTSVSYAKQKSPDYKDITDSKLGKDLDAEVFKSQTDG